ncbi:MAG: CRISPR-associated endoribonuclease Cas6 [Firmicutes bacterium]|nr:CRISPR-associated endoribonuclease Cas6 [Bacillota bacterium]
MDHKVFRLFTFSRLQGQYRIEGETIGYFGDLQWTISSPLDVVIGDVANLLIRDAVVRLGAHHLAVESVTVERPRAEEGEILVRTLSPITVHQTVWRPDGKPYALHLHPKDRKFQAIITDNLWQKYRAVHGAEAAMPAGAVHLEPIGQCRERVILYKGGVIKGYTGRFFLEGPLPLVQVALDAGLGSRNAQGFGLVEIIDFAESSGGRNYADGAARPTGAPASRTKR